VLKNIVVAAAVLGSLTVATIEPAAAQTVRRHLHCEIGPSLGINTNNIFGGPVSSTAVVAKNNWSFTIPRGTKYTYRVNNRSYTVTSQSALAPNAKMALGDARGATTCQDVWIPG
jgi:hypothetical protein